MPYSASNYLSRGSKNGLSRLTRVFLWFFSLSSSFYSDFSYFSPSSFHVISYCQRLLAHFISWKMDFFFFCFVSFLLTVARNGNKIFQGKLTHQMHYSMWMKNKYLLFYRIAKANFVRLISSRAILNNEN